jgi:hypothetical protein
VPAKDLRPHPLNWRVHPPGQRAALEALLREIGFANALLARELPDGTLQLIDGHLRAETTPEMSVPVLILDVDEREAEKLLATLDPLAALADVDAQALSALHARIATDEADVQRLLNDVQRRASAFEAVQNELGAPAAQTDALQLEHLFHVIVECRDEASQHALFDRLVGEGFRCRALVL